MHAYLFVSPTTESIDQLSHKLNAKVLPFPLQKIEDVRALNNFLRLTINEKTLVLVENIDEATTEALNAFLKNLEEPQELIYFCLTCQNEKKVLPTIVSRCQVIKIKNTKNQILNEDQVIEFLKANTKEKMFAIDKIKDRKEAINFINDLIYYSHKIKDFKNQENFLLTLKNLKLNGNIALQLTSLVVRMENANGK